MLVSPTRRLARIFALMAVPAVFACTKNIIETGVDHPIASAISVIAGNNQTGAPSQALPIPPTVRVLSSDGKPVGDITVLFTPGSGGSVPDGVARTDANGVAVAGKWTLGPTAGQQTLTAAVPAVATATFVATAIGGPVGPVVTDRVSVGFRPYGIAVSSTGLVYTSQLDGRSVTRVLFGATITSGLVRVGETPTDVTFDPTASLAFVTNQFDPSVGIIDVATGTQRQVISGSATMFRVLVSPNGQRAYATETDGKLLVIDVANRALLTTVPIGLDANGLAFGPGDTLLYVTSMRGTVTTVNLKTNAAVRTWTLNGALQDVALSSDGASLFIAHEESGVIDVVNATTGVVSSRIPVSAGVFGLKLSPDGRSLYATQPSIGQIIVINPANGVISRTFNVGGIPRRIGFDRASGRAIVSNEFGWLDYLPAQ